MAPRKGENTKKAAGNAKKAEVAAQKQAVIDAQKAAEEDKQWSKGSKSNAKKEADVEKKAEAARKKAERDALLAEEEKSQRTTPKGANAKTAQKKTVSKGTLDLSKLDDEPSSKPAVALNASGIDNALDALSLTSHNDAAKIDRHPERRFKAAYAAFEARRLPEIEEERPGLRKQQRIEIVRKEFEKHPDNPFNQANARFDSTKEEIADMRQKEKAKIEGRLASP